jgi:glycine cleavage system H lipoate-binding protein
MSHESQERPHSIVPPEEAPCVWMTAGILSYQLCERGFDCDRCPLDAALRMHFPSRRPAAADAPPEPERRALPPDRLYSRGHCWLGPAAGAPSANAREPAAPSSAREPGAPAASARESATPASDAPLRVGIEPALAAALPTPRSVVFPMPGERLRGGAVHLWIVISSGVFPLAAPVDGTLRRVNPRLASSPHLLAGDPLGDGWLYELEAEPGAPEKGALMRAAAAARAYDLDVRAFQAELRRALRSAGSAARTLSDGGAPLPDVSEMLGPARYLEIVRRSFG